VAPQISDFTLRDATNGFAFIYQYADNYNGYSWSDGTPEVAATNTPTGVWAFGTPQIGSGFQIEAPADTSVRTLHVYVGAFAAVGHFEAHLSDVSAPGYTNSTLVNIRNGPGRVYSITYSADSPAQKLIVRWTLSMPRAADGNVTLQAAALTAPGANNPPFATITSPASSANILSPANISIVASAFDVDGTVAKIEFFDGPAKLGEAPVGGNNFIWNDAPPGHHLLTVRVTDNTEATRSSPPIDIFVHTSGGMLSGGMASSPANVDLTTEGSVDWAHWGLAASNSFNHKDGVVQQIGNFVALGTHPVQQYSNNFTAFSWTDGLPVEIATATPTGIFVSGYTNGFELGVPAQTTSRRLKVYVGLYGAQGTFQAFLSDSSAPAYTDMSLDSVYDNLYAVYTLDYAAASSGQNLIIRYLLTRPYDVDYGNVTWQAVTLSGGNLPPMPVTIINPMISESRFSFSFETEVNRTYAVQYTVSLAPTNWLTFTNLAGDGTTAHITDTSAGDSQRFYRVGAQ
jgi:hypothetical protein